MVSRPQTPLQCTAPHPTRRRHQQGFTLIELMICVVILGILASWAAPGLANLSARMTLDSEVERVWQLLRRTRMEAAQSGQSTWLCATDEGTSCNKESKQWNGSMLLFIDSDDDQTLDNDERVVTVSEPAGNQVNIDPGSFSQGMGYTSLGFTRGRTAGTFTLTNPALTGGGTKIVVHFARIRTEPVDDTVNDPDDEPET